MLIQLRCKYTAQFWMHFMFVCSLFSPKRLFENLSSFFTMNFNQLRGTVELYKVSV
jgi:hypothetical protein